MMRKKASGYTLIEILVGLTILGLLFSFGYVSFRDFSRRQQLSGIAKQIQGDLRMAQTSAISGQKPDNTACTGQNVLTGYNFNVYSATEYLVEANCSGSQTPVQVKDVNLLSGITMVVPSPNPLVFKVLGEGTNISMGSTWRLTLSSVQTQNPVSISVSTGGEIQ